MAMIGKKLKRSFYARDTVTVAKELLGTYLVHRIGGQKRVGRIVETEAYLGCHDLASHSSKGKTKRNAAVFGPVGRAYVYLIYGMYECMNVVTERHGKGAAILIRAVEPVKNCNGKTSGPGLLCKQMGITRARDGDDLLGENIYICASQNAAPVSVVARPRVGVDYAGVLAKRRLRFYIKASTCISKL